MDVLVGFAFWLLWTMLLWTAAHKFYCVSICFHMFWIYLQEWNWWVYSKSLGTIFLCAPFYIPASSEWGSSFSTFLLLSDFLTIDILVYMKCCLIVVSIWISPTANDVEHLFICLLVTCVSSLEKCLFESFAHFWIELFVFLLLIYNSSFSTSASRPFSGMWFANIFSYSMSCFFTHLMVSFEAWMFLILMKFNLPVFSFFVYTFNVISKNLCLTKVMKI